MIFFFVSVINDFFLTKLFSGINNQRRLNGSITQNTETTFAFNPFFFQHWMQLWQKKGSLRKRESCRQDKTFFLHQFNHSNKASVEKKKFLCVTKNIALNQTTFVWREDFAFNQIVFFFLSLEEFYYDFCFFTKIIVLKRKAFSHRYATSRWQTSEKEKIFGGEKKLIHFEVQRGNLFWTLVILLIKHEKLLDNGTIAHFPFRVGCTQFFLSFHFFCHVKSSKLFDVNFWECMNIIRKNLCTPFFPLMNSFVENFLMKNSWKPF